VGVAVGASQEKASHLPLEEKEEKDPKEERDQREEKEEKEEKEETEEENAVAGTLQEAEEEEEEVVVLPSKVALPRGRTVTYPSTTTTPNALFEEDLFVAEETSGVATLLDLPKTVLIE